MINFINQSVSIVGVPMEGLHTQDPASAVGDNKADFISEFIMFMGFPFGNTFHMRLMNAVKFLRAAPRLIQ